MQLAGVLLVATATSLGWGLRGIWGHWWGVTVPGVFAGMTIWLVYGETSSAWQMFLFGTVLAASLTIGTRVSTLKIVGYVRGYIPGKPAGGEAIDWDYERGPIFGLFGVFLAGGMWGFYAGAALGVLITDISFKFEDLALWGAISLTAAYITYRILVQGLDLHLSPPRGDSWAASLGGCLGTIAFFIFMGDMVALRSSIVCWIFFGVGYQMGALIFRWSERREGDPGWKAGEHTIGFFGGIGLAISASMVGTLPTVPLGRAGLFASGFIVLWLVPYLNISNNIDFWRKGSRLERDMRKYMPKLPKETEFKEAWIAKRTFTLLHTSALISLIPFTYLLGTMISEWDGTRFSVWPFAFLVCLLTVAAMAKSRFQRPRNMNWVKMAMYSTFPVQALVSIILALVI
jgi:hypothetical protein